METTQNNFAGMSVAAFESRRASDIARLIERFGGQPHVSPSMREVANDDQSGAVDFANRLMTGQVDIVVIMTGVGFRHLLQAIQRRVDLQRFLHALSDSVTVARGPKPVAAMREVGLEPTYRVPEPNTWRELLGIVDASVPVANQRVGLQEYGKTNPSLIAGLEARGAEVISVKVYSWALPEDIGPLKQNIQRLAAREIDVAMFTSANQLANLLSLAEREEMQDQVKLGLRRAVVASIGPTTTEALSGAGIPVDFEPSHPKMGQLVSECAAKAGGLLDRKNKLSAVLSTPASDAGAQSAAWYDSPFMKACRRQPCETTPIWLMRQAGRYLPEYRKVRAKTTFLELCKNPSLCAEIMVKTVQRLGVDAAIIFSDLLPILEPMGMDLEYAQGEGPVIHNPVREAADVDRVIELETTDALHFVFETVKLTRAELPDHIPLIGFAGAPFTLASYAIEGGSSKNYIHTKTLMYRDEGAWRELMQRLARAVTIYLNAQIAAGAQCVQLFDSWVGCLGPEDYRRFVLPYVKQIISSITPGIPLINFATGNPALLPALAECGEAVIGIEWRVRLDDAWRTIGHDRAVQGNLDPAALLAPTEEVLRRAHDILRQANGRAGHIFNLGHGVLPQTPVDNVLALIDAVHQARG